jgi:threonine/homoserine/homoserine lactone efflux protein
MTLHNYLLFVLASIALALAPGPDMAYVFTRSVAQGRRAGILAALGFNLGGYTHMTAAALGLSAILATSATAFSVIKWLGAAYLIYLGIGALRSSRELFVTTGGDLRPRSDRTILYQAFLSDVLNPKVAMFFIAFIPQFIDTHSAHPTFQIVLLGVTVNMVCLPINILLACFAARLTRTLRQNNSISKWLQRSMGALFIALGLRLATQKL